MIRNWAIAVLLAPILLYRHVVSPLFPPACRFQPTCSEYAMDALRTHGPLKGLALSVKRLSRCHPFIWLGGASGFDPVPPK